MICIRHGGGLSVEDLSYYVENCYDYIVTSSMNSRRYDDPKQAARYPVSAAFYNELPNDPRYELAKTFAPAEWRDPGTEDRNIPRLAHPASHYENSHSRPAFDRAHGSRRH